MCRYRVSGNFGTCAGFLMGNLGSVHSESPSEIPFFYQNVCHGPLFTQIWVKLCKIRINAKKKHALKSKSEAKHGGSCCETRKHFSPWPTRLPFYKYGPKRVHFDVARRRTTCAGSDLRNPARRLHGKSTERRQSRHCKPG